ncbi:MAG: septum formation initiator family protein [Nocardioides sp.]|uniref:FtsB family cell division protein n=1 Tax=Nocardioides sp. TaxID=35761 RepID=UPI0039E4DE8C
MSEQGRIRRISDRLGALSRRPRGRTSGPSRRNRALIGSGGDTTVRPGSASRESGRGATKGRQGRPFRPRMTGRGVVLVLVLAVLVISYASSLKAYLQQRHDITALRTEIAQRQESIEELKTEKQRWRDPAYVKQQARERFGYVMPGDTSYVALDANGKRIQASSELGGKVGVSKSPTAWWSTVWGSVELAGDPPSKDTTGPAATIGGDSTSDDGTSGDE